MITVLTRFLNVSAFKTYSKVIRCYRGQEPTTDFKKIATVTSTTQAWMRSPGESTSP